MHPAVELGTQGVRILIRSNAVPFGSLEETLQKTIGARAADGAVELRIEGTPAGWILPDGVPLLAPPTEVLEIPGQLLTSPWDLMHWNAHRITEDLSPGGMPSPGAVSSAQVLGAAGVQVLGAFPVTFAPDVQMDPFVVLDAREGPIHLSRGVRVDPFSRIVGPAWVGEGSRIMGGVVAHATVGPVCRIRGEVEAAVIHGWSNKAHDGYLGHAVVGSWVNLGAFTTNSDLKNTYGPVRAPLGPLAESIETGLVKAGVLLGDHVKTGIGTLLGTGTVVGAGTNLFGGVLPPTWVPPFSWGTGDRLDAYRLDRFLEVTERAMARRGISLTPELRAALTRAYEGTRGLTAEVQRAQ